MIRVPNKLMYGAPWHLEGALGRCPDSEKINTAYIERLPPFVRRSVACMQRRTNCAAKVRTALKEVIDLLRCYYNVVRPHGSLKFSSEYRTPAQQAGLVSRRPSFK